MAELGCQLIEQRAQQFIANKKWYRALSQRAAVAIIVQDRPALGTAFLMIQRAEREGDPWSGQMAFPGGKHDSDDKHITHTALREIQEELDVASHSLQRIGRLSDILARPYRIEQKPMVVSPLLFRAIGELEFCPNEEVADVLWVPISYFMDASHRQVLSWNKFGRQMQLPCYYYQDKKIWGLSLMMIDEFLRELLIE